MRTPILLLLLFSLTFIVVVVIVTRTVHQSADLLLINGVVHTMNPGQPLAEAVAVGGDRIVAVGSTAEVRARFPDVKSIDLHGRAVFPGFTDSHGHLVELGASLSTLNLVGLRSPQAVAEMVRKRAFEVPPGRWVNGRGWDQNLWPGGQFPTHQILDEAAPDIPVYLIRIDGHAVWVNAAAMKRVGISRATPDPSGGRIVRDSKGEPTGVLVDAAVELLAQVVPPPTEAEVREAVRRAGELCATLGITEMHDMGEDARVIGIYKDLIDRGELPVRLYVAINGEGETWDRFLKSGPLINYGRGMLTVRALKLYADGALGSRGAALIEPYGDDPENRGLTLMSTDQIAAATRTALEHGFQVCTHAIGDRANHITLDAYERALKESGRLRSDARLRIEHVQVLDPADIARFHSLGVIPSMQPTHATSDMAWAGQRLGERTRFAYAWRSLLATGVHIASGSDVPVEDPNPLLGLYAAVTREDASGNPPGGWHPEQKMTLDEALKSYTTWAAESAFQEQEKGMIVPRAWADLVVLSKDITDSPPGDILSTTVVMTMVGGVIVYQNASAEVSHEIRR